MKVSLDTCLKNKTVTNGCRTNHQNDVFGWYVFLVMLLDYVWLVMSLDATLFFRFGDVIGVEQVWWLSINLQSNKVIVFGQISLFVSIIHTSIILSLISLSARPDIPSTVCFKWIVQLWRSFFNKLARLTPQTNSTCKKLRSSAFQWYGSGGRGQILLNKVCILIPELEQTLFWNGDSPIWNFFGAYP